MESDSSEDLDAMMARIKSSTNVSSNVAALLADSDDDDFPTLRSTPSQANVYVSYHPSTTHNNINDNNNYNNNKHQNQRRQTK